MNIGLLEQLGEWTAVGFYEAIEQGLPWPRNYGLAYRRLYEHMDVEVQPDRYLAPCEPFHHAATMASDGLWTASSGMVLDFDHNRGLRVNRFALQHKRESFPQHVGFLDDLAADLEQRLPHYGGYTHNNPDIRRVVQDGFLAMQQELDEQVVVPDLSAGERDLLLALQDYAQGVRALYDRTCRALQQAVAVSGSVRLRCLADAFDAAFLRPANNFYAGLLAVHFAWLLDGCDSIGRIDQVLGDLYEQDLASGVLTEAVAGGMLDEWWRSFETMNGWNLQIGGRTPDGRDGCNVLTRACIHACERNRLRRPNVAFRITRDTPRDFLVAALRSLRNGSGRPALYNDDLYIRSLLEMDLGLTEADAREIGFGGCTETMIAGLSNVGSLEGSINLAKCLELALHDGLDPISGRQVGPKTGPFTTFPDFDAFHEALRRQVEHATREFARESCDQLQQRFTSGDPKLYRTFFTRDCVRNRRSFEAGGARYNWAVVSYQGIANLIDSMAAIRRLVFEQRTLSAECLMAALRADFNGHEVLLQRLWAVPKFGNDVDWVDRLGHDLLEHAWRELLSHRTPRGGRFLPSCILFNTYLDAGRQVGATPDGRKAFTALVDSVGAVPGRDVNGPTALLQSVARLPLNLAVGTPVLNLRFQKTLFQQDEALDRLCDLVGTYFRLGGMQVQVSVLSADAMRAAQQQPENYRDLIVRIGGYSEYFVRLDKDLQGAVIERTEHAV